MFDCVHLRIEVCKYFYLKCLNLRNNFLLLEVENFSCLEKLPHVALGAADKLSFAPHSSGWAACPNLPRTLLCLQQQVPRSESPSRARVVGHPMCLSSPLENPKSGLSVLQNDGMDTFYLGGK